MDLIGNKRSQFVVITAVIVAALHFVTGIREKGIFWIVINGYLIDILLPFSFYFLFTIKNPSFKIKMAIGLIILLGTFTVETAQYFGIYLFGCSFDVLDYFAYLAGVLLALIIDRLLFNNTQEAAQ